MIELKSDKLVFTFPEVHPHARLEIELERTLRIPDDGSTHFLPPGLGRFPVRHVDDYAASVPVTWLEHGGVMLPMYQSEAMWINFHSSRVPGHGVRYPFAVKIAAGKIDAVTGESWTNGLHGVPQDYLSIPTQPWLDGFCVEKGIIRQFVAMPLGAGYTAEEQISGTAKFGGLQIIVYPMKRAAFERRFPKRLLGEDREGPLDIDACISMSAAPDMGLAPGGRMKQEIYQDPYGFKDWDRSTFSRCFVHIANSLVWRAITGEAPPGKPPTAREYTAAGLPWFDYYAEGAEAVEGSEILKQLRSVIEMSRAKRETPVPENESVGPGKVIRLGDREPGRQVREGMF